MQRPRVMNRPLNVTKQPADAPKQPIRLTEEEKAMLAKIHAETESKEEFEAKAREYLKTHRGS